MSIIRKIVKFVSGSLFSIFLIVSIFLFSFTQLLSYENLKPIFMEVGTGELGITREEMNNFYIFLDEYCKRGGKNISLPMGNFSIELSCEEIYSAGKEGLSGLIISKAFEQFYYTKYECDLLECLKQKNFLALFSQQASVELKDYQMKVNIATLLLGILFLLTIETWDRRFKNLGSVLVFTLFPIFLMNYFASEIISVFVPSEFKGISTKIAENFSTLNPLILLLIAIGIIFLSIGFYIERSRK
jgi:hypothetical protein